jgi:hypothetical protein
MAVNLEESLFVVVKFKDDEETWSSLAENADDVIVKLNDMEEFLNIDREDCAGQFSWWVEDMWGDKVIWP